MTVTSLSASVNSAPSLFGLKKATREITDSTERLSSGIRFTDAGDDVGGMSVAARLNGQIAGMRQAQLNNLQADSMLQTAYSAASTISDILDSMRILAVQANSGSLTDVERATLDVEFQALKDEMDSIASETSFGDVSLLDGTANATREFISSAENASQATIGFDITSAFTFGESIRINGISFRSGIEFTTGVTATDTATNLYNAIRTSTTESIARLDASLSGTTITLTSKVGGSLSNVNRVDDRVAFSTGAAKFTVIGGVNSNTTDLYYFTGGTDNGLVIGNTRPVGSIGDTLVNTQSQTRSTINFTISNNDLLTNGGGLLRLDDGTAAGYVDYTVTTGTPATSTEVAKGATSEETLDNLVAAIRNNTDEAKLFAINQQEFLVTSSSTLAIQGRVAGSLRDSAASLVNLLAAGAGTTASGFNFNTGTQTGVNTDGVVNEDFVGTISGFSATYVSNDNITASLTVGDVTYSASITDTTPASATTAIFESDDGGLFQVQLAAGGLAVANQTAADTYAARLDTAFSTLTFYQSRNVSSFAGTGQLGGATAFFNSTAFTDLTVNSVAVTDASSDGQAAIEIDIEGETYSSGYIGRKIGGRETLTLTSASDSNRTFTIINGGTAIDLSDETTADTFAQSLRTNFGMDADGNGSLEFQVGSASDDIIATDIASASSDILFDNETPDITSQENAVEALGVIDAAIDELGEVIASIGAAQSRLSYNYSANESAIAGLDFARASIEDTDIAFESTSYAQAVVRQQAAVAVLAQTQRLNSSLLDLLTAD